MRLCSATALDWKCQLTPNATLRWPPPVPPPISSPAEEVSVAGRGCGPLRSSWFEQGDVLWKGGGLDEMARERKTARNPHRAERHGAERIAAAAKTSSKKLSEDRLEFEKQQSSAPILTPPPATRAGENNRPTGPTTVMRRGGRLSPSEERFPRPVAHDSRRPSGSPGKASGHRLRKGEKDAATD
ncbi:unnamed protein product [Lampetra fluviatilis]